MRKNKPRRSESTPSVATVVTTSALSLSLMSCVPDYVPSPSPNPGGTNAGTSQGPIQYSDSQALSKYFNNGYNYTDAEVLAKFWGGSPGDAKVTLGHKMLNFGPSDGAGHVSRARNHVVSLPVDQWPVWFDDGGYSYTDMERLGRYWGAGTWEAKVKVARQMIQGQDHWNRSALSAAIQSGV